MKNHLFQIKFATAKVNKEWNDNSKIVKNVEESFFRFLEYRVANNSAQFKYVMTEDESGDSGDNPIQILAFKTGSCTGIQLPSKLLEPFSTGERGTEWLELIFAPPLSGSQYVKDYLVTYYEEGNKNKKKQLTVPPNSTRDVMVKAQGLSAGKKYFFQVQSRSSAGLSPPGPWSEGVDTDCEIFLSRQILQDSILVKDSIQGLDVYTPKSKIDTTVCEGLRKIEIGVTSPLHYRDKTIMVVGATGVGKTTFLNSMANYLYGVRENDPFR